MTHHPSDNEADRTTTGTESSFVEPGPEDEPLTRALQDLLRDVAELKAYVQYLVSARLDLLKASLRRAGILAAVVGLAAFALLVVLAVAIVQLMLGLAGALTAAFDSMPWVGAIAVGGGTVLLLGAAIAVTVRRLTQKQKQRTVERYERKQNEQRVRFGRTRIEDPQRS